MEDPYEATVSEEVFLRGKKIMNPCPGSDLDSSGEIDLLQRGVAGEYQKPEDR